MYLVHSNKCELPSGVQRRHVAHKSSTSKLFRCHVNNPIRPCTCIPVNARIDLKKMREKTTTHAATNGHGLCEYVEEYAQANSALAVYSLLPMEIC